MGARPTAAMTAVLAGLAALAVAVLTVAVLVHPGPLPGELATVRWWQRRGEPIPSIAEVVWSATGTEGTLVMAAVPIGWLLRRHPREGTRAVAVGLLAVLAVQPLTKEVIERPRPTADQVEVRAAHESASFPSGHSLSSTTFWGALTALAWRHGRRRWAIAAVVPIVVTGLASAINGVHWPSDAIAGTIAGAFAAGMIVHSLAPVAGGGRPAP